MKYARIIPFIAAAFLTSQLPGACHAETAEQRGNVIAQGLCSRCHAVGSLGDSPLPAAPRFRSLDARTDLSKLAQRLRGGLLTGHEGMPMFRFDGDDADAVAAYVQSIQSP